MGSKSRIAKDIVPIIQQYIDDNNITVYIEPFVGGANVIDKIQCEHKYGYDISRYLIALLKHVQQHEELYDSVPRDLYSQVRADYNTGNTDKYEDWEIGNIGFLASYNGRFFDGGFARPGYEKSGHYRDYYRESKDNLLNQADALDGIIFGVSDYRDVQLPECPCVIYCDPPYQNTKHYALDKNFNYAAFWETMKQWSRMHYVLISEQNAPDGFIAVWEKSTLRSVRADKKYQIAERLYIAQNGLADKHTGAETDMWSMLNSI